MIRLARVGARKQPYYRVVVIEKDRARNGRSVEVVGTYNPRTSPASVDLKLERIEYWKGKGAQPSDRVAKLLRSGACASRAVCGAGKQRAERDGCLVGRLNQTDFGGVACSPDPETSQKVTFEPPGRESLRIVLLSVAALR